MPEGLRGVALRQPGDVLHDEGDEPLPVRPGDACGKGFVHTGGLYGLPAAPARVRTRADSRFDGVLAVTDALSIAATTALPDDHAVREAGDDADLLRRRDAESDGDGEARDGPADAGDELREIQRQGRAGAGGPAARHEIDEATRERGRAPQAVVRGRRREKVDRVEARAFEDRSEAASLFRRKVRHEDAVRPGLSRAMRELGLAHREDRVRVREDDDGSREPVAPGRGEEVEDVRERRRRRRERARRRAGSSGPSASGSLNGMPSSTTSAPDAASAGRRRPVVARSGSPASTKTTRAARPASFARANAPPSRVTGSPPRASRPTRRPCRRVPRGSRGSFSPGPAGRFRDRPGDGVRRLERRDDPLGLARGGGRRASASASETET